MLDWLNLYQIKFITFADLNSICKVVLFLFCSFKIHIYFSKAYILLTLVEYRRTVYMRVVLLS